MLGAAPILYSNATLPGRLSSAIGSGQPGTTVRREDQDDNARGHSSVDAGCGPTGTQLNRTGAGSGELPAPRVPVLRSPPRTPTYSTAGVPYCDRLSALPVWAVAVA